MDQCPWGMAHSSLCRVSILFDANLIAVARNKAAIELPRCGRPRNRSAPRSMSELRGRAVRWGAGTPRARAEVRRADFVEALAQPPFKDRLEGEIALRGIDDVGSGIDPCLDRVNAKKVMTKLVDGRAGELARDRGT
jgi:hypothetical protein